MESKLKLAALWGVAAVSGGAIGSFAGVALSSWLISEPKVLGADWWEVMTAFGTVGATFFAGHSVRQSRIIAAGNARRARASVLEPKRAGYYALSTDCIATYDAMIGKMNSAKFDDVDQGQCNAYHWTRLSGDNVFQVPIVEDGEWAVLEEKLADLMARIDVLIGEVRGGVFRLLSIRINVNGDVAIDEMNKIDDAIYKASLAIRGLYPDSRCDQKIKQRRVEFLKVLRNFKRQ